MSKLRVIISGGGTGGHIFPAIAIANALKESNPEIEILFVGATGRMEMEKVPQAGYKIIGLNIAGIQRSNVLKNIGLPIKLASSFIKAYQIVNSFKPHVAVGVGGYASGPILRTAAFCGVPTVIQEQNSYAGMTNKWLARNAHVICTAYPGMEKFFPKEKVVFTGNPVRKEITQINASREQAMAYYGLDSTRPTVLIVGGSLGARTINKSVEVALERIKTAEAQVLWQTGKMYYEECAIVSQGVSNLHAKMFLDRMDYAYTSADVIVSRAGALSISELQLIGKPVILVPSPNVAEDHQTHNAMALVNQRAAIMVKDDEARVNLITAAFDLLQNKTLQQELSANISRMAIPDAAKKIVEQILKVASA